MKADTYEPEAGEVVATYDPANPDADATITRGEDILSTQDVSTQNEAGDDESATPLAENRETHVRMLNLIDIADSPYDPRVTQDAKADEELAASIREKGVLQPLLVRQTLHGYEVMGGHRRKRAAQKAGCVQVPCIVYIGLANEQAAEIALIDNIQRVNIELLDEAFSYARLKSEFHMSVEQIARKVSRSRQSIYDALSVKDLPDQVIGYIRRGELSFSHGVILARVRDEKGGTGHSMATAFAERAVLGKWPASALEDEVRQWRAERDAEKAAAEAAAKPPLPIENEAIPEASTQDDASTQDEPSAETEPEESYAKAADNGDADEAETAAAADATQAEAEGTENAAAAPENGVSEEPQAAPDATKADEAKEDAPTAKTPASAPSAPTAPKVPEGMLHAFVPKEDCEFCQANGVAIPDVFALVRRIIEMGKPKGLEADDVLSTTESLLND